jgi:hypothetical protein
MFPIPLYYIWTPKYEVFHVILQDSLKLYTDVIEPRPIFISQEDFDNSLKEANGFGGWFLKIDKILELLHILPTNSYFIFSDADMYFFPDKELKMLFDLYIKATIDFVGMRESNNQNITNIGFLLMRVCDEVRNLFINTHTIYENNKGISDQHLVNLSLKTFEGSAAHFPTVFVLTSSTMCEVCENMKIHDKMVSKAIIFQPLPHGDLDGFQKRINKLIQFTRMGVELRKYEHINLYK